MEKRINKREEVLKVLRGEKPSVVPVINEWCMDNSFFQKLNVNFHSDWKIGDEESADFFDNFDIGFPWSGFGQRMIVDTKIEKVYEYETGAKWREVYQPMYFREMIDFPIKYPEDVFKFKMPPIKVDRNYIRERTKYWKEKNFFVQAAVPGVWMGTYYYLTTFENILMWMVLEPESASKIFELMGNCMLESIEIMMDCGVDCVVVAGDMGSGTGLLFSKELFKKYNAPYYKKASEMCHQKGVYFHLHSHGHIQDLMDDIVDCGIDIINPIGPSDNNDLKYFKEKWGDKIVFSGGISTRINTMTTEEIEKHIVSVMEIGTNGNRFMPRTESGIPLMEIEKVNFFIDTLKKYRYEIYGK